jgi:D-amino-acid dehydrogenase
MHIAIIGAGIVGVTTAFELVCDGHQVTVFERRSGVARETSFANAGVIAPGYVTPWAAPGMPWKVLRQMWGRHAAVRFAGPSALAELPWIFRWWLACRPRVHKTNRSAMQRLAQFSRARLLELTRALSLEYEQAPGYLVLLRGARELRMAQGGLKLLQELGVSHELVDAARCRELEPALNPKTSLLAAIHLPNDGVGNCRQFAHLIKAEAQRLGAAFRFDAQVTRVEPGAAPCIETAAGERFGCEAVVLCTGPQANALLRPHGLSLPLAAVHGYSITAPLRQRDDLPSLGPCAALMDEKYKVAISRLGQRVRVAGSAELGGSVDELRPAPLATLYRVLDDWFPGAAVIRDVQQWKGARPMLPDGPPVLGASGRPGLWLNLGHGSSGWALACGSARIVADLVSGRDAPIDLASLGIARLR